MRGQACAVYSGKGYSGSNLNRPEFQHLREDGKAGGIGDISSVWDTLETAEKNRIACLLISRVRLSREEIIIEWTYDFARNAEHEKRAV